MYKAHFFIRHQMERPPAVFGACYHDHTQQFIPTGISSVDLQILQWLDDNSLKTLCVANKLVAELCRNEDLWKNKLVAKYGPVVLDGKPGFLNYRRYYFSLDETRTIAAGEDHAAVLDVEGNVYTFGANQYGQLGLGDNLARNVPERISGLLPICSVACGTYITVLLGVGGEVYTFGQNDSGQLGLGDNKNRNVPTMVGGLPPIQSVACDDYTVLIDFERNVYVFGCNYLGQLGLGDDVPRNVPIRIHNLPPIRSVDLGFMGVTMLVDYTNKIYACGYNEFGGLLLGHYDNVYVPTLIQGLPPVRSAPSSLMVITSKGTVYIQADESALPVQMEGLPHIRRAAVGESHTVLLDFKGHAYGFGGNSSGQLGVGSIGSREDIPTLIQGLPFARQVACGYHFTLVADLTGHVYSFGSNHNGQLGLGDNTRRCVPTLIPNLMARV